MILNYWQSFMNGVKVLWRAMRCEKIGNKLALVVCYSVSLYHTSLLNVTSYSQVSGSCSNKEKSVGSWGSRTNTRSTPEVTANPFYQPLDPVSRFNSLTLSFLVSWSHERGLYSNISDLTTLPSGTQRLSRDHATPRFDSLSV